MCSHYQALKEQDQYLRQFGVQAPLDPLLYDIWPGYRGCFVRLQAPCAVGEPALPQRELVAALFGLIPHWAKDTRIARSTYNARSETVAAKPSFRDAWRRQQRCIVAVEAFFEPDWRSGKARPARICQADGAPLGLAGLWSRWHSPAGEIVHSYTVLTVNADQHALLRQFHKPGDEKRMPVILPPQRYQDWLQAPLAHAMEFMQAYPAQALQAATA